MTERGDARGDRGEKTAKRFGSFVRIRYLCTIICVTIKFEIMENNIQKEDLLALVKSKIYTIILNVFLTTLCFN